MLNCSCLAPPAPGRSGQDEFVRRAWQGAGNGPAPNNKPSMLGRYISDPKGETASPATARTPSVDPERLKGVSSPPEDSESPDPDGGFGGLWRHIPLLPGLVEAIVGTPYDEDEEDDDYLRHWHHVSAQAGVAAPECPPSRRSSTGNVQPPIRLRLPAGSVREPFAGEHSALMAPGDATLLTALCPLRFHHAQWHLMYSTLRDGISMQTMLRQAQGKAPTFLVVRDMNRNVFGAYCSEAWKISKRFYGTGETFVFRLGYEKLAWKWWSSYKGDGPNDYFMWGDAAGIAVGGAGGFALWLDNELARGLTRACLTFGSPPLGPNEEFDIGAVELWWLK